MALRFMDNKKDNQHYLKKVLTDLTFIVKHTNSLTQTALSKNEILLDSIMFRLIQISENSDKLTDDFKMYHSNIPWRAIKGLRNRIVHEYGNVDLSIIFNTVKDDIPQLLKELETIAE